MKWKLYTKRGLKGLISINSNKIFLPGILKGSQHYVLHQKCVVIHPGFLNKELQGPVACRGGGQSKKRGKEDLWGGRNWEFPGHMTQLIPFSHLHLVPSLGHHRTGYLVTKRRLGNQVTWVQILTLPLTVWAWTSFLTSIGVLEPVMGWLCASPNSVSNDVTLVAQN